MKIRLFYNLSLDSNTFRTDTPVVSSGRGPLRSAPKRRAGEGEWRGFGGWALREHSRVGVMLDVGVL